MVTYVVGLPDDVAKAMTQEELRHKWDLVSVILKERNDKTILFKKAPHSFSILDQRVSRSKSRRETLIELSKIKGKPYFLKMEVFATVTKEMDEKVGEKAIKNSLNSLKNLVATEDSVSELNISLSNIKGELNSFNGNPTLVVTDMIAEIEEVDVGEDAYTEIDEEEGKESNSIQEEVKIGSGESPLQSTPPSDDHSFNLKFEADLLKTPSEDHIHIRTAKKNVGYLLEMAENPDWKEIKTKPNRVLLLVVEGGLKCIKGEGVVDYTPEEILEYL